MAALAFLNMNYIAPKIAAQDAGFFYVYAGGEQYTVTMADIEALSPYNITANYKPSGKNPETRTYRGVPLKAVADSLGIDCSGFRSVSFTAADGYATALTLKDAIDGGDCYIAVALGGKPLGTRANGGDGPFMMLMAHDQYSQRWCKYLLEVRFK